LFFIPFTKTNIYIGQANNNKKKNPPNNVAHGGIDAHILEKNRGDDVISPTRNKRACNSVVNSYKTPNKKKKPCTIDLQSTLYIVFDLETTGFSPIRNHIIQIAMVFLTIDGTDIKGSEFESLIKPQFHGK
jgi:DNA polymerase III epsilon subunit-like protein